MVVYTLSHVIFVIIPYYLHFIGVTLLLHVISILQIWKMRFRVIKQFGSPGQLMNWNPGHLMQNPELFLLCGNVSWDLRVRMLLAASKKVAKLKWLKYQGHLLSYLSRSPEMRKLQGCSPCCIGPGAFHLSTLPSSVWLLCHYSLLDYKVAAVLDVRHYHTQHQEEALPHAFLFITEAHLS